jgi:Fringe-like
VLRRWFCHFDDDNDVNIPKLLSTLGKYSPQEDWYLGKPSIRTPLEILDREKKYAARRVRIDLPRLVFKNLRRFMINVQYCGRDLIPKMLKISSSNSLFKHFGF